MMDALFDINSFSGCRGFHVKESTTINELWLENMLSSRLNQVPVFDDDEHLNGLAGGDMFEQYKTSKVSLSDSIIADPDECHGPRYPSPPFSPASLADSDVADAAKGKNVGDNTDGDAKENEQNKSSTVNNVSLTACDAAITAPTSTAQMHSPNDQGNQKRRCASSGAVKARYNREKKKQYISSLEGTISQLTEENAGLTAETKTLKNAVEVLSNEVAYLRNIVENQSELSKIVRAVASVPGININSSAVCIDPTESKQKKGNKRKLTADKAEYSTAKASRSGNSGICLHVQNGSVSLELCSQCNMSSQESTS